MIYNHLKLFHILSATFFLLSILYSCHYWWSGKHHKIPVQTAFIIIPLALVQLMTGFTLISLKHENLSQLWIKGSTIAFIIMMMTWLGFVYLLNKKQRGLEYICITIAFIAIFSMIFFMANKI